jgi:DNA-binding LytR/AlgR family response regulator
VNSSILRNFTILVVEDEYLLATDLCAELASQEAEIIGPAATVEQGLNLSRTNERLSAAILDVNLRGEQVFALADELLARNIPVIFATGYDASVIPAQYVQVPRIEKPLEISKILEALKRVTRTDPA